MAITFSYTQICLGGKEGYLASGSIGPESVYVKNFGTGSIWLIYIIPGIVQE